MACARWRSRDATHAIAQWRAASAEAAWRLEASRRHLALATHHSHRCASTRALAQWRHVLAVARGAAVAALAADAHCEGALVQAGYRRWRVAAADAAERVRRRGARLASLHAFDALSAHARGARRERAATLAGSTRRTRAAYHTWVVRAREGQLARARATRAEALTRRRGARRLRALLCRWKHGARAQVAAAARVEYTVCTGRALAALFEHACECGARDALARRAERARDARALRRARQLLGRWRRRVGRRRRALASLLLFERTAEARRCAALLERWRRRAAYVSPLGSTW